MRQRSNSDSDQEAPRASERVGPSHTRPPSFPRATSASPSSSPVSAAAPGALSSSHKPRMQPQSAKKTRSSSSSAPPRSASSPLAVSVSGPAFPGGLAVLSASAGKSSGSSSGLKRDRSEREYRGKCLYQSRKCENERALKRNGKAHNLCDEHRSKQNQHQRKFDAKKFSRKRRRDSGGKSGDEEEEGGDDEHLEDDRGHHETRPVDDNEDERGIPEPQRKIRRFEGAKGYAVDAVGRYSSSVHLQEYNAAVYKPLSASQPIKSEASTSGSASSRRSPYAPGQMQQQQYGGGQARHQQPYPPPPGYVHNQQYTPNPSATRPVISSALRVRPGIHPTGPSPRHSVGGVAAGRPPTPLRPITAIAGTPSSRIPVSQIIHAESAPGPDHGQTKGEQPGFGERRAAYNSSQSYPHPGESQQQRHYLNQQGEYSRYPGHEISTLPAAALARSSSAGAYNARVSPKYSHSELIAASILVPTAAAAAAGGRPPYSEIERQHPPIVTPRGVAAMHASSYAISPHHARSPASSYDLADKQQQYYLRAQQTQQHRSPVVDDNSRSRSHVEQQQQQHHPGTRSGSSPPLGYHSSIASHPGHPAPRQRSPPSTAPLYSAPGPRKLPSLSTPQLPPPHISTPRMLPSPPISSVHHRQPQHVRHPQPSPPRQMLPSLAPFRPRDPSRIARPQFQTPTSSA